jgi:hypothetical protein
MVLDHRHVRSAIDWLLLRNGNEPTLALYNLAVLLRSIARNWLPHNRILCDELDDIVQKFFEALFPRGLRVVAVRTKDFLTEFEGEALQTSLLDLGKTILARHEQKHWLTRAEALEVQGALAVALALALGLGPSPLAALRLGRDIICRPGQRAVFKSSGPESIHEELPGGLTALIGFYCTKARDRLQPSRGDHLFPGKAGSKVPVALARQMAKLVERECGIRITASHFKNLIAVVHLKRDPDGFEFVRDLRGNRDVQVVKEVFGQLHKSAVNERFDRTLVATANPTGEVV